MEYLKRQGVLLDHLASTIKYKEVEKSLTVYSIQRQSVKAHFLLVCFHVFLIKNFF